jgi:hypothetical protein
LSIAWLKNQVKTPVFLCGLTWKKKTAHDYGAGQSSFPAVLSGEVMFKTPQPLEIPYQ